MAEKTMITVHYAAGRKSLPTFSPLKCGRGLIAVSRLALCTTAVLGSLILAPEAAANQASPGSIIVDEIVAAEDGTNNIQVSGRLDASQSFVSLDINGYTANLGEEGEFSVTLPASQEYQMHLYAADGGYQTLNYAGGDIPVDAALQLQVGEHFLAELAPPLASLLNGNDLAEVLKLGEQRCAIDTGWLRGCDVYIDQVLLQSTPVIDQIYFSPNGSEQLFVNIVGRVPKALLATRVKRPLLWGYRNSQWSLRDVDVKLQITMEPTEGHSVRLVVDQASDVNIKIGEMSVTSNTLAAHLVPVFKDAVAALINAQGVTVLGSHLAKLPIPVIPETLAIDLDGDQQNDAEFGLQMDIQSLDVVGAGDGYVLVGGTINALKPLPGREVLGSRRVGGLQPQSSPVAAPVDLQARLKVDFVNQVLMAIYQSGVDQKIVLTVKVEDFGSLAYQLTAVGVAPGSDVDIAIDLGGAPEMLVNGLGSYALGLEALLPRASLSVSAPTSSGEQLILAFTGDFWLDTSVGASHDGALQLEFGHLLKADVSEASGGLIYDRISGLPEETVHDFLEALVVSVAREFEPLINALLAAPRLELDIGRALTAWLSADFTAVQAGGNIVETGVSEDDGYLTVGADIFFP